ncbi:hypothetical protein [Streptomyces adonidis]|uniref:hypothetical protein n=1 Tax=Streptomyces adonidis TaxID=3231367 RepID=UPI0034DB0B7A
MTTLVRRPASASSCESFFGAGEADLQSFDFTEPVLPFSLGDAVEEVVPDLGQALSLREVWPQHRAADAGVFVNAWGAEGSG